MSLYLAELILRMMREDEDPRVGDRSGEGLYDLDVVGFGMSMGLAGAEVLRGETESETFLELESARAKRECFRAGD